MYIYINISVRTIGQQFILLTFQFSFPDDDYIGHNSLERCSMCEVLGPIIFCKECKIILCIKCKKIHDKVLRAHIKEGMSLEGIEIGKHI